MKAFYNSAVNEGMTEAESFCDYVKNCMVENNGTLITPKKLYTMRFPDGMTSTLWNIRTDIGRYKIVRRHGPYWKADNGGLFSAEDDGTMFYEGDGSFWDVIQRISEDVAVIMEEV